MILTDDCSCFVCDSSISISLAKYVCEGTKLHCARA